MLIVLEGLAQSHGASLADTIVLAGNVGVEMASGANVPFTAGRGDASEEQTDAPSFDVLEPVADGFRNFLKTELSISPEEMLLDKAHLLGLTAAEMTVLIGGLRSIGVSATGQGVWSSKNTLDSDWFNTLLDMGVTWKETGPNAYEAADRSSGMAERTASRADLIFGSNSELRAIAELYAQDDSKDKFKADFISAWNKVMTADLV